MNIGKVQSKKNSKGNNNKSKTNLDVKNLNKKLDKIYKTKEKNSDLVEENKLNFLTPSFISNKPLNLQTSLTPRTLLFI